MSLCPEFAPPGRSADAAAIRLLSRRLDGLPGGPGKVARFLRARRIRGVRDHAEDCPLARYLSAALPPDYRAQVGPRQVRLLLDGRRAQVADRPLPSCAAEFAAAFDAGHHPALER